MAESEGILAPRNPILPPAKYVLLNPIPRDDLSWEDTETEIWSYIVNNFLIWNISRKLYTTNSIEYINNNSSL